MSTERNLQGIETVNQHDIGLATTTKRIYQSLLIDGLRPPMSRIRNRILEYLRNGKPRSSI